MTARTTASGAHPLWLALFGILLLPFIELAAFFWVAARIGFLPAMAVLVATSFLGASLLRRQGGLAFARVAAAFRRGEPPHGAAREGFLVGLGGVLMILPGFVTDIIGFALILPSLLRQWQGKRVPVGRTRADASRREGTETFRRASQPGVLDLDRGEWHQVDGPTRPRG
jgi:UPF0716 protein FxsA